MKISEQIENEILTLSKMNKYGFWMMPNNSDPPIMCIHSTDLQKYFRLITDKIKELESNYKYHIR